MLFASSGAGPERAAVDVIVPPSLAQSCTAELQLLLQKSPAIRFACLSLTDGRPFAFAGSDEARLAPRLAAITASFLGLSESFARESQSGRCTHTTISTENGTIIVVKVAARTRGMALSIGADRYENLAMVLRRTLDAADAVAARLDA